MAAVVSILGEPLTIAFTDVGRSRWQFGPGTLYLRPDSMHPASELLEKALREKARTVFAERLAVHAPLLGVSAAAAAPLIGPHALG